MIIWRLIHILNNYVGNAKQAMDLGGPITNIVLEFGVLQLCKQMIVGLVILMIIVQMIVKLCYIHSWITWKPEREDLLHTVTNVLVHMEGHVRVPAATIPFYVR
jgi:hypothetical protein